MLFVWNQDTTNLDAVLGSALVAQNMRASVGDEA